MKIIINEVEAELIIKKSKFIARAKPIYTVDEAEEFVSEIKKENYKATHNVFAYTIGEDYKIQKYSDDGEPQGSSAMPIINMLKSENIIDIAIVVTRYFGGIKLGVGNLGRAYVNSTKEALEKAPLYEIENFSELKLEFEHAFFPKFQHEISSYLHSVSNLVFSDKVYLDLHIKKDEKNSIFKNIIEALRGKTPILNSRELYGFIMKNGDENEFIAHKKGE